MKIISNKEYKRLINLEERLSCEESNNRDLKELNDKLINWFRTMLENNGYKIDRVPYTIRTDTMPTNYYGMDYEMSREEIIVPEIHIAKFETKRKGE